MRSGIIKNNVKRFLIAKIIYKFKKFNLNYLCLMKFLASLCPNLGYQTQSKKMTKIQDIYMNFAKLFVN